MSDAPEWKPHEQDEFTKLYNQLEHGPNYNEVYKKRATEEIFSSPLPYSEAKSRLVNMIQEQQHSAGGLEHMASTPHSPEKKKGILGTAMKFAFGAAGIATMGYLGFGLLGPKY